MVAHAAEAGEAELDSSLDSSLDASPGAEVEARPSTSAPAEAAEPGGAGQDAPDAAASPARAAIGPEVRPSRHA